MFLMKKKIFFNKENENEGFEENKDFPSFKDSFKRIILLSGKNRIEKEERGILTVISRSIILMDQINRIAKQQ